jgi:hypothetical protein
MRNDYEGAKMIRRMFTILSALSLVLCVATCGLWVRSYSVTDYLSWNEDRPAGLTLSRGRFVGWRSYDEQWPAHFRPFHEVYRQPLVEQVPWGFAITMSSFGSARYYYFPTWFPTSIFAVLPTAWAVFRGRLGRGVQGDRCRICGYDLRATPDRCPECGAIPVANGKMSTPL